MNKNKLEDIVQYIVLRAVELKNKCTDEIDAQVEFVDIFAEDKEEFQQLTNIIMKMGKVAFSGPTGNIYLLYQPIKTVAGILSLVKIRIPDESLHYRGDADFNTNFSELLKKHQDDKRFEHIVRDKFEMLRLSDPNFDVMSCFSSVPVRDWI
jgi:hypothetical protein